jgi:phosphomannomutase/phosphoglucomutase
MSIFRSYDIRGVYGKDLTDGIMRGIGNALGNHLKSDVVLGRDCRLSSPSLRDAFIRGYLETGRNVVDAGMVPLGAGMFYGWKERLPFAYITGSHLSKEWNGIKFFHANGIGFIEGENLKVRDMYMNGPVVAGKAGKALKPKWDVLGGYKKYLVSRVKARKRLRVVIDSGNGMAGVIAPDIFRAAGFEVDSIFDRPDGRFPNRSPDPMEDPLKELRKRAKNADIGIAYDGDGDRITIVDNSGNRITTEQSSCFIMSELLKREKGAVVANVECTRVVDEVAGKFGRKVRRIKVGHTFLMDEVKRSRACFGVELSGHLVIPSLVPFDDSMAVSLYAASVLSGRKGSLSEEIKGIPAYPFERINLECPDRKKFEVVEKLKKQIDRKYGKVNLLDGIRVDTERGWALIRPSNTGPLIRLTVEGETEKDKESIKKVFSSILQKGIREGCK